MTTLTIEDLETMECASTVIAAFLRAWNDSLPTDADRQRLVRPLLPLVVGSRADNATELRRSYMALDWLVKVHTPAWLLLAGLHDHAEALFALDEITGPVTMEKALPAVNTAWDAARDAARDAPWDAAGDAARFAAWAAAWAAARDARDAAWHAAWAAARTAAWAGSRTAAWDAALYAARTAAWTAAGDALLPTVAELQVSAQDLVRRMVVAK